MTTKAITGETPRLDELAELETKRDEAHREVRSVQVTRDAWEAELPLMRQELTFRRSTHPQEFTADSNPRPLPKTAAAKLEAAILERLEASNPHEADYAAAYAPFQELDQAVQDHRRNHIAECIEELRDPATEEAVKDAIETLSERVPMLLRNAGHIGQFVALAPGFDGQDVAVDGRLGAWLQFAESAMAEPLMVPQLSELGNWKADRHE